MSVRRVGGVKMGDTKVIQERVEPFVFLNNDFTGTRPSLLDTGVILSPCRCLLT